MSSKFVKAAGDAGTGLHTNYTAQFLIFHFVFAYAVVSTRGIKNYLKIDHNNSPRQDTTKYGEKLVQKGKLSKSTYEMLVRWEAAHANSVENYPLFVAAVLLANLTLSHSPSSTPSPLTTQTLTHLMTIYTLCRLSYVASYILISSMQLSWIRTLCWWGGNLACLRMLWFARG